MSSCVRQTKGREEIKLCVTDSKRYYQRPLLPHYLSLLVFLPFIHQPSVAKHPMTNANMALVKVINIVLLLCAVCNAEHSGAYSSPQYAKKMYPKEFDTNALLPRETPPPSFNKNIDDIDRQDRESDNETEGSYNYNSTVYGRSSFLETAGDFMSSSSGQFVSGLAKDFIARSTGSSQVGFDCITQVLSLNLTNLVILIVLKALILAAGFFGAGAWKGGHYYGRSLDDSKNAKFMSEDEILLYLSYLSGQQSGNYSCLNRLSCQRPQKAGLYSSGAELLLQGAKLMNGNSVELGQYETVTRGIREAAAWGEAGNNCSLRYQCGD